MKPPKQTKTPIAGAKHEGAANVRAGVRSAATSKEHAMTTTAKKPARTKPEAKKAVGQDRQAAGTACRPFVVHVDEERHDLGRPVRVNAAVLRLRKPPDGGQARIWVRMGGGPCRIAVATPP
jgi:hypothetical protein